ncbi:MAG: rhomboid family intramembrane serine protease [Chlamydiae bacterium]|nr:rhomboid family intramembrane serine protease [Chlamydiota bacterium]
MNKKLYIVKFFAMISLAISLIAGVTDHIFPALFGAYTLSWCLALHPLGIAKGFYWQIFTHPFIHPAPHGLDLLYLISLGFSSYLLWKIGTMISVQKGLRHFLTLFFTNTLISSIVALAVFYFSGAPALLAGGTPIVYALLLGMIFLLPEVDLLLFLAIPVKAKWFILGSMGAFLLIDLSHGNFVHFFSVLTTLTFTYFYCLISWKIHSPFKALRSFEDLFIFKNGEDSLQNYAFKSKIYDIRTGKILLNDELFVDACLAKIADKGKDSLSWREKWRLKKISKKKRKALL